MLRAEGESVTSNKTMTLVRITAGATHGACPDARLYQQLPTEVEPSRAANKTLAQELFSSRPLLAIEQDEISDFASTGGRFRRRALRLAERLRTDRTAGVVKD